MIISPAGHYFDWTYVKPSTFAEVSIKVDPNTSSGVFQAGFLGIIRYGQNWTQCGWVNIGVPYLFCELWHNSSVIGWQTFGYVAPGATVKVAANYTAQGQWILWLQAPGQPWIVASVADITLSTGQYLTPQNASFWVSTEGEGTLAPPLFYSVMY